MKRTGFDFDRRIPVKEDMMVRTLIVLAVLASTASALKAAEMKFYQLPSGSYPHDVAPAPDGTVWFSGQQQGFAGRFDPQSGKLEKISLGNGAAPGPSGIFSSLPVLGSKRPANPSPWALIHTVPSAAGATS